MKANLVTRLKVFHVRNILRLADLNALHARKHIQERDTFRDKNAKKYANKLLLSFFVWLCV